MKTLPLTFLDSLVFVLLATAFVLSQVLIGGTRLVFSLPAYGLIGAAACLTVFSRRAKPAPDQFCLATALVFFSYIIVRAVVSPDAYLARTDLYCAISALLVYFLVAFILVGAKQRLAFLICLSVVAMAHVVVGLIQFAEGNNFMPIWFLQRFDYGRRASGFYVCPNHLAGLLEVLGIFGVSIVCWSRWPIWGKLLTVYAAAVCYLGVVLSGSRTGYLSSIASLFVFTLMSLTIFRRANPKVFVRVAGPLILAGILVCAVAISSIHKSYYLSARASNIFGEDLTDPSIALRTDLWGAAVRQWTLEPLWGTGSGTYLYYGRKFRSPSVEGDPVHVHNDYLHLLAEYGLAGAAGALVLLAAHLWRGWKTFSRLGPKRVAASPGSPSFLSNGLALNLGALGAVAAYAVHSISDFNLHIPANALLIAFVFGILANSGFQRGTEARRPAISIVARRFLLPALGLVLVIQCARLLPGEYFAERSRAALRDGYASDSALLALKALDHERNNPHLYFYLGRALASHAAATDDPTLRARFSEAATVELDTARRLAPLDEMFMLHLADVYDAMGRFSEADRMYRKAIALDPNSSTLRKIYEEHLQKWRNSGKSAEPNTTPTAGS